MCAFYSNQNKVFLKKKIFMSHESLTQNHLPTWLRLKTNSSSSSQFKVLHYTVCFIFENQMAFSRNLFQNSNFQFFFCIYQWLNVLETALKKVIELFPSTSIWTPWQCVLQFCALCRNQLVIRAHDFILFVISFFNFFSLSIGPNFVLKRKPNRSMSNCLCRIHFVFYTLQENVTF